LQFPILQVSGFGQIRTNLDRQKLTNFVHSLVQKNIDYGNVSAFIGEDVEKKKI
jgi:hypothetical protein